MAGQMPASAAQSRKTYLALARGELHRVRLQLTDDLTVHQINAALQAKNVTPEARITN